MPLPTESEPLVPVDTKAMAYTLSALRLCSEAYQAASRSKCLDPEGIEALERAMASLVKVKNAMLRRNALGQR